MFWNEPRMTHLLSVAKTESLLSPATHTLKTRKQAAFCLISPDTAQDMQKALCWEPGALLFTPSAKSQLSCFLSYPRILLFKTMQNAHLSQDYTICGMQNHHLLKVTHGLQSQSKQRLYTEQFLQVYLEKECSCCLACITQVTWTKKLGCCSSSSKNDLFP